MESVIQINSDDNIDKLLEKASIFNKNEEQENIKFLIFHCENKSLVNCTQTIVEIHKNKLSKKELIEIALSNQKIKTKKFDLVGIYKYEVDIDTCYMKEFCQNPQQFHFMTEYKNYQDIPFKSKMDCLNEQSCVILLFSRNEKPSEAKSQNNKTQKKVKFNLKATKPIINSGANKTKKII